MKEALQNKNQKVLIIGAGVAGLCAGVYAKKSGFDVEILEMNHQSGGLAMSWKRHDYVFETCLHWLLGSKPGSTWHRLWSEVFNIDALKFVDLDEFVRLETDDGQTLVISRNVDQLEETLLKLAPEDRRPILRLTRGIRRLQHCELPLSGEKPLPTLVRIIKTIPYLPELQHWSRLTQQDLAKQFRNPLLRRFFDGGEKGLSAIATVFSLAWMNNHDAGYPIGGSQAVIRGIEKSFRDLGGQMRFGAKVERVLTEGQRAVGVRLAAGTELRADWVISAADGHATLYDWIPEKFRDAKVLKPYQSLTPFGSYVQVSFGVRRNLSHLPAFFTRALASPLSIDPRTEADQISFRIFHYDPTFAPPGKTAVTCFIPTRNTEYWVKLHKNDPATYALRKKEIADEVARVLEQREPGIVACIEETDVSTPATVQRFTGNWKGSMEGFLPTPRAGFKPLAMKIPGLHHFRMIGQWVMPGGGLPSGLMTARSCIQDITRSAASPGLG